MPTARANEEEGDLLDEIVGREVAQRKDDRRIEMKGEQGAVRGVPVEGDTEG